MLDQILLPKAWKILLGFKRFDSSHALIKQSYIKLYKVISKSTPQIHNSQFTIHNSNFNTILFNDKVKATGKGKDKA